PLIFWTSLPLVSITGLSFATITPAQMRSSLPIARESQPFNDLIDETWVGFEPGIGCRATIDWPVPWTPDFALKLQTMRSPFVNAPEVIGAIVRPYGFPAPLTGSTPEPTTTCFLSCLSTEPSGDASELRPWTCETAPCGVAEDPPYVLQPLARTIAATAPPAIWNGFIRVLSIDKQTSK